VYAVLHTIAENIEFNLFVSDVGNVVLLHKSPLGHDYDYVQFDEPSGSLEFMTIEGKTQNLGMNIPEKLHERLQKTRELLMVEVTEDYTCQDPVLLRFIQTITV